MQTIYKYPYLTTFLCICIIQTYIYAVVRKKMKWTFTMEQTEWWPYRWEINSEDVAFFKKWVLSKGFYFLCCVDGLIYVWLEYTFEVVYRINKNFPALMSGMKFGSGIKLIFVLLFIEMWVLWYRGLVHEYIESYPWDQFYKDLAKVISGISHILWAVIAYLFITLIWKSTPEGILYTIGILRDEFVEEMVFYELGDYIYYYLEQLYNYLFKK